MRKRVALPLVCRSRRRKVYDETGITSDDLASGSFDELKAYFDAIFKRVTKDDIEQFEVRAWASCNGQPLAMFMCWQCRVCGGICCHQATRRHVAHVGHS